MERGQKLNCFYTFLRTPPVYFRVGVHVCVTRSVLVLVLLFFCL